MSEISALRTRLVVSAAELDRLLAAQIAVAWAGEGGKEEKRLSWWRSELMSEFGGEDLFSRLLPHQWRWAVVQGAREAARRQDAEQRARGNDPDQLVTLFSLGFALDERAEERLQEVKRAGLTPKEAFPVLHELIQEDWSKERFTEWVRSHGEVEFVQEPIGRRLKGSPPESLELLVKKLIAALLPLGDNYPMPHFRRSV